MPKKIASVLLNCVSRNSIPLNINQHMYNEFQHALESKKCKTATFLCLLYFGKLAVFAYGTSF